MTVRCVYRPASLRARAATFGQSSTLSPAYPQQTNGHEATTYIACAPLTKVARVRETLPDGAPAGADKYH